MATSGWAARVGTSLPWSRNHTRQAAATTTDGRMETCGPDPTDAGAGRRFQRTMRSVVSQSRLPRNRGGGKSIYIYIFIIRNKENKTISIKRHVGVNIGSETVVEMH